MTLVESVNGKTGNVTLVASDILIDTNSGKTIEFAIGTSSYRGTTTKIDSTEDDYLLTITKGA